MNKDRNEMGVLRDPDFDEVVAGEAVFRKKRTRPEKIESSAWLALINTLPSRLAFFLGLGLSLFILIMSGFFTMMWLLASRIF